MDKNKIGSKVLDQNPLDEKVLDENWAHGFNAMSDLGILFSYQTCKLLYSTCLEYTLFLLLLLLKDKATNPRTSGAAKCRLIYGTPNFQESDKFPTGIRALRTIN